MAESTKEMFGSILLWFASTFPWCCWCSASWWWWKFDGYGGDSDGGSDCCRKWSDVALVLWTMISLDFSNGNDAKCMVMVVIQTMWWWWWWWSQIYGEKRVGACAVFPAWPWPPNQPHRFTPNALDYTDGGDHPHLFQPNWQSKESKSI